MEHPQPYSDTDPRAMEVWLDLLRKMPPGEKLAAVLAASHLVLRIYEAGVRLQTPADGLKRILETLDRLGVPYMVGASAASYLYGAACLALEIDLIVDLRA